MLTPSPLRLSRTGFTQVRCSARQSRLLWRQNGFTFAAQPSRILVPHEIQENLQHSPINTKAVNRVMLGYKQLATLASLSNSQPRISVLSLSRPVSGGIGIAWVHSKFIHVVLHSLASVQPATPGSGPATGRIVSLGVQLWSRWHTSHKSPPVGTSITPAHCAQK